VSGGAGDDTVSGGAGNDRIQGDNGNDWLYGGDDDDLIMEVEGHHATGPNNDRLWGDAGNDTLQAGAGNDYLDGGQGDDVLRGGTGDDRLSDTNGANLIDGGAGNDLVDYVSSNVTYYGSRPDVDQIYGGSGQDRFVLNFDPHQPMIVDHVMDFETGSGGDVIDLTDMLYRLPASANGTDLFDAGYFRLVGSGDDTLLEADLLGTGFSTVLVLEATAPEAFTAANFDMVQ
jgi:Ca2+-binding RTX toxin-like protein